ncbi:MAG: tetratricopeptide repeat protein [Bacteroidota bacterium]
MSQCHRGEDNGHQQLESGDLETAERLLKDALTADVMHGPAHNNLGQVYYQQKRYYEAAWEFQYAIRLMPHQPIPRNNLGMVYEATGKLVDAAEQYALAVAEEPDNPVLLGNLARTKIRLGEQSSELRELLQQIVIKDTRPEWRVWAEQQLNLMPSQ